MPSRSVRSAFGKRYSFGSGAEVSTSLCEEMAVFVRGITDCPQKKWVVVLHHLTCRAFGKQIEAYFFAFPHS